jgi:putative transposase
VRLADLLWKPTVVSQKWLVAKLEMKSAANVSQQLRRLDVKAAIKKVPDELKPFLEEADATNS